MVKKSTQSKEKMVPKLRFKGFEGGWNNVLLEDVGDINPSNNPLPDNFVYIDLESVEKGKLKYENKIIKKEAPSRAQRVLQKKDILFQTVRPYQQNNLYFNLDGEYVASTGYAQIRAKQDPMFLYQYLHTQSFLNKVLARCTGSSYPAINSSDIKKIRISIPEIKEQKKIGSFLESVDSWVENLSVQKEKLEEYKKGMMRKIFSQEVRFEGFEGAWEDMRLREVGNIVTGTTPPTVNREYYNGEFPWITPTDINNKKDIYKSERFLSKKGLDKGRFIPKDSLLVTCIASIGKNAVLKVDGSCNQQINAIIPNKENNVDFLYYLLEKNKNVLIRFAGAGGMQMLNKNDFSNLKFKFPSIQEQDKIANFLNHIDSMIDLKQKEIEKVENYKKGLIQNLFV